MNSFSVLGSNSKKTSSKKPKSSKTIEEWKEVEDDGDFEAVRTRRGKDIDLSNLSKDERKYLDDNLEKISNLLVTVPSVSTLEKVIKIIKTILNKYIDSPNRTFGAFSQKTKDKLEKILYKALKSKDKFEIIGKVGNLLISETFNNLDFIDKLYILKECNEALTAFISTITELDKRVTFETNGREIKSGGVILYKFENGSIYLLLSYVRGKGYSDLGGKSDMFDKSPEDIVSRETYEESNTLIDRYEIDRRLKDNWIYIAVSKYILYYVKANERESQLVREDFGFREYGGEERTIDWIPLSYVKNIDFHPRLEDNYFKSELRKQIENEVYELNDTPNHYSYEEYEEQYEKQYEEQYEDEYNDEYEKQYGI